VNKKIISCLFISCLLLSFSSSALEDETFLSKIFDVDAFMENVITGFGVFDTGELFRIPTQYNKYNTGGTAHSSSSGQESQEASGGSCEIKGPENCYKPGDEDCNGYADCADSSCVNYDFCQTKQTYTPEICNDNKDNDGDGAKDCGDLDCLQESYCKSSVEGDEGFTEGFNTDNDLYTNQINIVTEQYCSNGKDDDKDGYIDCIDKDCKNDLHCSKKELCTNKVDDDGDSLIDCSDADCSINPLCGGKEDCTDNKDNDGDGLIDCKDPVCGFLCLSQPEICNDNNDNDQDGMIDCADPNCKGTASCSQAAIQKSKSAGVSNKLTTEEIARVNEYFREVNRQVLLMSSAVDKLKDITEKDPVWQQDVRREISYPLGVFAGRTSRASVEISKGNVDRTTVKEIIKRFNEELQLMRNRVTDAFDRRVQLQLQKKFE